MQPSSLRWPRLPEYGAKAAWISQAQNQITQNQIEMIVLGRHKAQIARHPEMDDQGPLYALPFAVDQQVLGTAANSDDATPRQQRYQLARDLMTQLRCANNHAPDLRPFELGRQAATTDLHLRQFRHCLFLRENPNNITNLLDSMRSNRQFSRKP